MEALKKKTPIEGMWQGIVSDTILNSMGCFNGMVEATNTARQGY